MEMPGKSKFPSKRKLFKKTKLGREEILSPEEFRTLVDYERTRSDRNGSIFSVAVFHPSNGSRDMFTRLVSRIPEHTRSIDRTGWNGQGNIAVLLPDTAKEGAAVFGKKLLEEVKGIQGNGMLLDIYSYPEHWLSNGNGGRLPGDGKEKGEAGGNGQKSVSVRTSIESSFVCRMPRWKRGVDLAGAALLFLLTSPIFLFLSIYVKTVSPGPVFFKQTRIGYKGVPFTFWKFRTMKQDNSQSFHGKHTRNFIKDGEIPMQKLDGRDNRIIFGGRVIRKSCMDELPQLWNIIRGEMSLVGPRPCIPYEAEDYLRWHTHRFDTVPGLTGLWQVSNKEKLTFRQMIRLDIAYCRNITFLGDITIILKTPYAILKMILEAAVKKILPEPEDRGTLHMGNARGEEG